MTTTHDMNGHERVAIARGAQRIAAGQDLDFDTLKYTGGTGVDLAIDAGDNPDTIDKLRLMTLVAANSEPHVIITEIVRQAQANGRELGPAVYALLAAFGVPVPVREVPVAQPAAPQASRRGAVPAGLLGEEDQDFGPGAAGAPFTDAAQNPASGVQGASSFNPRGRRDNGGSDTTGGRNPRR